MNKLFVLFPLACAFTVGCAAQTDQTPIEQAPEDVDQQAQAWGEPTDTVPRVPTASSVVYENEATIQAPVDVVWNLVTDLPGYSSWNPWVIKAEGSFTPGARVKVNVKMGPITQTYDHAVMTVTPKSFACWRDAGWNSWFVYGQRCRWFEQNPDGSVHYKVQLMIDGPLDKVAAATNGPCLQTGMAAETNALKERAEAIASGH